FDGKTYAIHALVGVPRPVQSPHPPLLVGGGGRRMLRLAGREADIVGVNANLHAGTVGADSIADVSAARMTEKVGWVREGAESAGRPFEDVELSMGMWLLHVTPSAADARTTLEKIGARTGVDPDW